MNHTTFTKEIGDEICDRLSEGEPLRHICKDKKIPWRTVFSWIERNPEFAKQYQKARDLGMDAIAEETLEIANTPLTGEETETVTDSRLGTTEKIKRSDMLGHRKLQIWTRLQLLARWNPKKYGDKVTHLGDGDAPIQLLLKGSDVHG